MSSWTLKTDKWASVQGNLRGCKSFKMIARCLEVSLKHGKYFLYAMFDIWRAHQGHVTTILQVILNN